MKATGAVKWRTHLALLFVLVLGIVLSPLRAVAATIPALFAYDVAIQGTATAPLGRIYAVPPERGGLPEYAYDAAHVGYDGTVNPQAVARAVAAGASEVYPVASRHGWRLGRIVDPYGHHWEIGRPPAQV